MNTQLKTLALLLVLVFGVIVIERADTLVVYLNGERATAGIFNPVATFLGINLGSSNSDYESLQTYDPLDPENNDGDLWFEEIPDDPFGINTPPPVNDSQNTVVQSSLGVTANTALSSRTPVLTCAPNVVSGGEEVIVMWACRDGAYTATSTVIDTGGKTIGSTRVTPTEDTTYTMECVNNFENTDNTSASCEIEVAKPALAIIATPRAAARGGTVTLSWKAQDVNSCIVTSDSHRSFERNGEEGDVLSPTLIQNTTFTLTCETITGAIEERSVSVGVE